MTLTLTTPAGSWLRRYRAVSRPSDTLVCFPHAGGAASFFRPWAALVPPGTDHAIVQYPGREDRSGEPFVTRMDRLADSVARVLHPLAGRPMTLFGHSMGASVAYEVALRLQAAGLPPAHLVVSSREGPAHVQPPGLARTSDAALVAELVRLGHMDPVAADPDLLDLFLSQLRADLALLEGYRPTVATPLTCPVTAVTGDTDDVTAPAAESWRDITTGPFTLRQYPGGHFFLVEHRHAVVTALTAHPAPTSPA